MNMVTVIGAGPIGLRAAIELQSVGWQTMVLEEHSEIGKPVNCSGLISKSGMQAAGLNFSGCIENEVRGAKLFSPNKTMLKVERNETVAFVIDREKFDKKLSKEAQRKGVEIKTNSTLMDLNKQSVFVKTEGRGELLKSNIVIGADGVNSKTRDLIGIKAPKENFVHAIQFRGQGHFEKQLVELHFGDFAKGFFAWVIPENEKIARIGLGAKLGEDIQTGLKKFCEGLNVERISKNASAMIPIGNPLYDVVKENVLLVGDSAFQTKASTGGGIVTGTLAAIACAKNISNHFKNKTSLNDYKKDLTHLNKELETHWKIRRYLNSLNEEQLNNLFEKMKKAGIEEFLSEHGDMDAPSKFLNKILWSPSKWKLLPDGLRILMK